MVFLNSRTFHDFPGPVDTLNLADRQTDIQTNTGKQHNLLSMVELIIIQSSSVTSDYCESVNTLNEIKITLIDSQQLVGRTHPASWYRTANIRLVAEVLVREIVLRTDEDTAWTLATTRYYTLQQVIQMSVYFIKAAVTTRVVKLHFPPITDHRKVVEWKWLITDHFIPKCVYIKLWSKVA